MKRRKPIYMTENDKKRFFEKVRIFQDDFGNEKWIWIGATTYGYGILFLNGTHYRAHCIAWYLQHGEQNPPDDLDVRHLNHIKIDISPMNLEIGTRSQNKMDSGIFKYEDVLDIRTSKLSIKELSKKYNCRLSYICKLQIGLTYPEIHKEHIRKPKFKSRKLSKDEIKIVYELYDDGLSQDEIAKKFGCSQTTISYHLIKRKTPLNNQ